MILWFILGLIVLILCGLFMLAILMGMHRMDTDMDMNKNNIRSMENTQNIEDSTEKEVKKAISKVDILERLYCLQNHSSL